MNAVDSHAQNWSRLKHAIIVCGHAVYHGGCKLRSEEAELDEHWFLQPFQKGEGKYYISHIKEGVMQAARNPFSLLLFSGGQTRFPCILSEAQGYHDIANIFDFWGEQDVRNRCALEDFSRDSFDNVLFSIARFNECVGELPQHLTVVSWTFKKARFHHHIWSIRWPDRLYQFVGVGIPENLSEAEAAEAKTRVQFEGDVFGYGHENSALGTKKKARNPYQRQHGYITSCPSMTAVLEWRKPYRISEHDVPWSS